MEDTIFYPIDYDISFFVIDKKKLELYPKDEDFIALNKGNFQYITNLINYNSNHSVDTNILPKIPLFIGAILPPTLKVTNDEWKRILKKLENKKPIDKSTLLSIKREIFFSKVSVFPYNTLRDECLHLSLDFWRNMGDDIYEAFSTLYYEGHQIGCENPFEDFAKKVNFIPFEEIYEAQFLKLNTCVCEKMKEKCQIALSKGFEDDIFKNEMLYFLDIIEKAQSGDYILCFVLSPY